MTLSNLLVKLKLHLHEQSMKEAGTTPTSLRLKTTRAVLNFMQSKSRKTLRISSSSHQSVKQSTWWHSLRLDANLFWSDIFSWHFLVTSDKNPHTWTGVTDLQIYRETCVAICRVLVQRVSWPESLTSLGWVSGSAATRRSDQNPQIDRSYLSS